MWEVAVHLAVACDVYHGVFLCCPIYIYIQLVPSLPLFTASSGRVYTGAFHRSYIILLSICTSRIPCSTYKLKLHTSKQGTTSNMQSITGASRERIQASHHVASCHDPEGVDHGRIQYQRLQLLFINTANQCL